MRSSIRAFDSVELTTGDEPVRNSGSVTVRSVLRQPAGIVGAAITATVILVAILSPAVVTTDPLAISGAPLLRPSMDHPMGTDGLGRDLLSGVTHGAGISLVIGVCVVMIAVVAGLTIGLIAGYRGGVVDDVFMRLTELFQVLPRFFLLAVSIAMFGPGIDHVILALGLTSWPVLARVCRSEVVAMRNLDFVIASEALGATRAHMLFRVFIPHVMPSLLVLVGLLLGQVLLMEASLGFLGLGDPSTMTWGLLAGQAQLYLRVAWWLSVFPGLAIMLTVMGFNLLTDAVSTANERA